MNPIMSTAKNAPTYCPLFYLVTLFPLSTIYCGWYPSPSDEGMRSSSTTAKDGKDPPNGI
jgi:hypothetical protein